MRSLPGLVLQACLCSQVGCLQCPAHLDVGIEKKVEGTAGRTCAQAPSMVVRVFILLSHSLFYVMRRALWNAWYKMCSMDDRGRGSQEGRMIVIRGEWEAWLPPQSRH